MRFPGCGKDAPEFGADGCGCGGGREEGGCVGIAGRLAGGRRGVGGALLAPAAALGAGRWGGIPPPVRGPRGWISDARCGA